MVRITHKAKVGPKGQIIIPKLYRENLGIAPGTDVILGFDDNKVTIQKNHLRIEEIAEKIAKNGKSNNLKPKYMRNMETAKEWDLT